MLTCIVIAGLIGLIAFAMPNVASGARRVRQKFLSVGTIDLGTANARGTALQIKTPKPIVAFHLLSTVAITIGTGAGVVQDAIQGWLRQLQITNGGTPIVVVGDGSRGASGGIMSEVTERTWLQSVPHLTQVLAASGTSLFGTIMPISVPPNRYARSAVNRSALRIGASSSWFIEASAGSIADLITTPGTATLDSATLEVIAEIDDTLDAERPEGAFVLFSNFQRQDIGTAAAVLRDFALSANGRVLWGSYLQRDNLLRSRVNVTDLQFRLDGSQIVLEGTWFAFERFGEFLGDAAANLPAGMAAAPFDPSFTLAGIPAAGSTGWDVLETNIASTGAAQDGINGQYYFARPLV